MKLGETIVKIGLAIAAVAGIVFVLVKYMDAIKAWIEKLCPCCRIEDEAVEEAEELVEEPAAEVADFEPAVEEVIVEETPVEEGTPVAEEKDFAE